jgi:hypothetical protein
LIAEGGEGAFVAGGGLLQVDRHRVGDEEAVGGSPRLRGGAEEEVFERVFGEGGEAGVDACGVGFEEGAFAGGELRENGGRERAEIVETGSAVEAEGFLAEEGGEFAGGAAALEIHLEKPLLRVEPAEGAGEIDAVRAAESGDAEGVAGEGDRGGEASDGDGAVEAREAGAQAEIEPADSDEGSEDEDAEEGGEEAEGFPEAR